MVEYYNTNNEQEKARNLQSISEDVVKAYKLKAVELREHYIYTMHKLLEIRNTVQKILDDSDFWKIYDALIKDGEEIWIN